MGISQIPDHYHCRHVSHKSPGFSLWTDQCAHEASGQYTRHDASDQHTDEGDLLDVGAGRCSGLKPSQCLQKTENENLLCMGSAVRFFSILLAAPAPTAVF